jgi:hypothetical protein
MVKLCLNSEAKDLNSRIPTKYYHFLDIFGECIAKVLPLYRTFDHAINLEDGTRPPLWSYLCIIYSGTESPARIFR